MRMCLGRAAWILVLAAGCYGGGTDPKTPQKEYSADDPGDWTTIARAHVPSVRLADDDEGRRVLRIWTPHLKVDTEHYVERIGVINARKQDIVSKAVGRGVMPGAALPIDTSDLYTKGNKIYLKCNLHDLWTVPLEKVLSADGSYPDERTARRLSKQAGL